MRKIILYYFLIVVFTVSLFSKEIVTVGVVSDGSSHSTIRAIRLIKEEVDILTKGEFIVKFPQKKHLNGSWTKRGIEESLNKLYKDNDVDIVLAIGFSTAAITVNRARYPKPTLVSTIIHTNISNAPLKGRTSGKHNLTYITIQADLQEELQAFQKIVPFKNVALISDALIPKVMPKIKEYGIKASKELGINLTVIPHNGENINNLISKIPESIEAVLIAAIPRIDNQQMEELLQELTHRGMPTHSMVSAHFVNLGALSSVTPFSKHNKYAKRLALGIQSVLLGENLKGLKVFINKDKQLSINMKTIKTLNISPSFDMMIESQKVGEATNQEATAWSLKKVSNQALLNNLNIDASKLNLDIGQEQIKEKESKLYPQLSIGLNHQHRKDMELTTVADQSAKASLSLNQVLYDPSTWASLDIEKLQQKVRTLTHNQTKLDIVQNTNIAFLNILKAKTLKKIQEDKMQLSSENLKLAKNKAKIGSATNSDIYRWESELANAQASFLSEDVNLKASKEILNQLLNRPLDEEFYIDPNILDNPTLILDNSTLYSMFIDNKKYEYLSKTFTEYGLENSPEIAKYLTKISIEQRNFKMEKEKYYIPSLSLNGEYSNTYYDNRNATFSQEGKNDWMVGVNLSLPLYEGGKKDHTLKRSKIILNQLQIQLQDTQRSIVQTIRDYLRMVQVSKFSIKLKQRAAKAAQKNYDLVYDAYSKGSMGIIELIDAQNSKVIAKLNAVNSTYEFFIDLVNLQHAIGNLDFFISDGTNHLMN